MMYGAVSLDEVSRKVFNMYIHDPPNTNKARGRSLSGGVAKLGFNFNLGFRLDDSSSRVRVSRVWFKTWFRILNNNILNTED